MVADLIGTLREARTAVGLELESELGTGVLEPGVLQRLHQSLCSFGSFADRLLVLMLDRGLDGPLMEEAEQLYDFFREAEAEIGARLAAR